MAPNFEAVLRLAKTVDDSENERELAEIFINLYTKYDFLKDFLEWAIAGEVQKTSKNFSFANL